MKTVGFILAMLGLMLICCEELFAAGAGVVCLWGGAWMTGALTERRSGDGR